jgi:hypothetical protein
VLPVRTLKLGEMTVSQRAVERRATVGVERHRHPALASPPPHPECPVAEALAQGKI